MQCIADGFLSERQGEKMNSIVLAGALTLFAISSSQAHGIEVNVSKSQTRNNIASDSGVGSCASGWSFNNSNDIDASTAYAGSIGVDADYAAPRTWIST